MKIFNYKTQKDEFTAFIKNSAKYDKNIVKTVEEIIDIVRKEGDKSLIDFSNKFDKANFEFAQDFIVKDEEIEEAKKNLDEKTFEALKYSYQRIYDYHKKQMPQSFIYEDEENVKLGNLWRAIKKIGVYAPGGTASYPSSVLMCAVLAVVAGVEEIVLCAPTSNGKLNDAVLVAAWLCGIKKIYKIGGAQAIAALAYGTESIDRVDKIVGPGNSYVAMAKKILFGEVGIDMIAGPTDLTIICDDKINPKFVAADALSQLEHGADSKVFIITNNEKFVDKILFEISSFKEKLSRQEIIDKSLKNSAIIVVENFDIACELANNIAPEHLEIACENAFELSKKIKNAGAIFIGNYTPEAIGDYVAGPSHTLPTLSTSKFASGLSVYDFLKRISLIQCDENSFEKLATHTEILAQSEGLEAHKLSVEIRRKKDK